MSRESTSPARQWARLGLGLAALAAVAAWISASGRSGTPAPAASEYGVVGAATAFLSLLDDEARAKATYDLGDEERFNWAFTPVSRNGLPLKDMTLEQRSAAHALLQATMSSQGYHKANAIIELERILGVLEGRPERRDPRTITSRSSARPARTGPGDGASRATTCRSTSRRRAMSSP